MTLDEILNTAAARLGGVSDYELAKQLGVSKQAISGYRHNRTMPDTYGCFRLAEILEINPLELVAMIEASKAKSDEKKEYFEDFLARLRNSTQKSGMLGIVFLLGTVAATLPNESKATSFDAQTMCIMSNHGASD